MLASTWNRDTPLRRFLRTEIASAVVLLAATLAALVWFNIDAGSYENLWGKRLSVALGGSSVSLTLREWVNSGLMTFFFFVIGLEARREFDIGELRERRRVVLPLVAGIGGMVAAIATFLAINAGHSSVSGWGVAMSTDTAFALGMLALVGRRLPEQLRAFILTVVVVDDLVALVVIATVYTDHVEIHPLLMAAALFALVPLAIKLHLRYGILYLTLGIAAWIALLRSGIDPIVIGLAMGLLTYATPAERADLERATDLFRLFREQPTPELARTARAGLDRAISPNERLQEKFHGWTSFAIVPLFAIGNAGIPINPSFLSSAYTSAITVGIIAGYVFGKPVGVLGMSWIVTMLSRGRLRAPVGWAAVAGGGAITGIGFTVALLVASLAFQGPQLEQAKLGVLSAALCAALLSWLIFRVTALLPARLRAIALLGRAEAILDLTETVDNRRDHTRGPENAPVTVVEYGDFECPYCGQAETAVRELLKDFGDLRYVWRHLPLTDVHPHAQLAAEASEAADRQGKFWEMRDLLFEHQDELRSQDLIAYAGQLGLDIDRFTKDLRSRVGATRVAEDVDGAALSGVTGTPTFFVNGRRHHGAFDIETLSKAVRTERARALHLPEIAATHD